MDTGPIVALLDRQDAYHEWIMPRFNRLRGRLVTTGAVVTETAFFLQSVRHGMARLVELLDRLRVEIRDSFQAPRLRAAAALMHRNSETPMDFADAPLVVVAEELGADQILTLDLRGFRTYRTGRGTGFRLPMQDRPEP